LREVLAVPFVQRNWKGEVTGVYSGAQPGYAEEELPDDHPDVVEFNAKHPVPPEFLRPLSRDEIRQSEHDRKALDKEHEALRNSIWAFNATFSELEVALSALLYEALHIPKSKVAYAIYHSPNGFDARTEIVDNVIQQLVLENERLKDLQPHWSALYDDFRGTRIMRNRLAHGFPVTLAIRGKNHARLTSPVFDEIRVGRSIREGRIPGLTASDISNGAKKARWLIDRVDDVNRLLAVFHEDGNPTLPEKFAALVAGLQTKGSH
jgi:uncharacterized protein with HEPN domain